MKNQDKKTTSEKALPRFGVLDAVIVILVIAAICAIYFRYNIMDMISAKRNLKEYTVEFSISDINSSTTRFIHENDEVRFADTEEHFGTLIKASDGISESVLNITPASKTFTEDGNVFEVFYPSDTRVNATGRMSCKGTYSENGIFLINGSASISSGEVVKVHTDEVTLYLCVLNISPIE